MLTTGEIILEYVCPALGIIVATYLFAAPIPDCYDAVKAGKGLGNLNPAPWAFCTGNCIGWITYGIMKQNIFILVGNSPGLLMSIWLNIQAVKLQYDGFRSKKMLKAITAALDIARDEERHISYSTEVKVNGQQQQQILPEVQKMSGKSIVIPSSNGSKHQPSNLDFARIVNELEAEKLDAPSSHDTVVMLNVTLWLVVISIVGFASVFSDKTKELIVGITVNLNLVVFYASPLTVIFKVLGSRSSASIHIPTMIGITLCGSFWAAYGVTVLDAFLAVPNALGALLGFIQIFLCLVFPRNTKNSSSPDEAPETVLDVTGKSVLVSSTDEEAVGGSIRQPRC